jgi:hypothetical protein
MTKKQPKFRVMTGDREPYELTELQQAEARLRRELVRDGQRCTCGAVAAVCAADGVLHVERRSHTPPVVSRRCCEDSSP